MPSNKLPLASSNPDHVLSIQGRKRHSIIGDGNCLFRTLAYIMYGTEDLHAKMRSLLVDFVSKNQPLFQPLVISGKLEEHIQYMLHSRQWGTQVELQAASTLFQMDLYTLRQSPQTHEYGWTRYKPHEATNLQFPTENYPRTLNAMDHMELCHTGGCHFDCIVDEENLFPLVCPRLPESHIYIDKVY